MILGIHLDEIAPCLFTADLDDMSEGQIDVCMRAFLLEHRPNLKEIYEEILKEFEGFEEGLDSRMDVQILKFLISYDESKRDQLYQFNMTLRVYYSREFFTYIMALGLAPLDELPKYLDDRFGLMPKFIKKRLQKGK